MPTLDFAIEISSEGHLDYTFFEKPMQSKWVTPANSAASDENKNTWLSNDLVRRLLRTSETLLERDLESVVNDYDKKLIFSWYKINQRTQIIERGISDYRERIARLKECGGKPHLSAADTLREEIRRNSLRK